MAKRIIIVGGGIGGLSAAVRLAADGHQVTLYEKNSNTGGKLNYRETPHPTRPHEKPFRFDTGPSLLTLPLVFADLFSYAGRDVRNALSIHKLDPVSRFVWRDGQTFELSAHRADLLHQVRQFAAEDVEGFEKLLSYGQHIWDLSGEFFLTRSPEQALRGDGAFSPFNALKMLSIPLRIGMFRKFSSVINRHIRSPRLREVLYQYATYSGASPFLAPATLAVIPYVELGIGGWYVQGGMYQIACAIESLARDLGVAIHTNTPVGKILVDPAHRRGVIGVARGVQLLDGTQDRADAVIVNADVVYAYRDLIDPRYRKKFADDQLKSSNPAGRVWCCCWAWKELTPNWRTTPSSCPMITLQTCAPCLKPVLSRTTRASMSVPAPDQIRRRRLMDAKTCLCSVLPRLWMGRLIGRG